MSEQELIKKITEEVVKRLLKESGAEGKPGAEKTSEKTGAGSGGSGPGAGVFPGPGPAGPYPAGTSSGGPAAQQSGSVSAGVILPSELAKYIDHTLLKPEATQAEIDKLCEEAVKYKFASVCVNTSWASYCARKLRGSGVKLAVVVGFPLGAMSGRSKGFEARHAIEEGAKEIDMVINIGALKSGHHALVEEDIRHVRRACGRNVLLKVILETALLTDEEKVLACQIAKNAEADFVKTSTGFSKGGATAEDVALMRRTVGPKMGVKASGGVRTYEDAVKMIRSGATRLGTSSGVALVTGGTGGSAY